jgi:hypothetical protein
MIYYFFLIIAVAIFSILAYYRPLISLYLIVGLLPTYLIRYNFFGIPMTWLETMIIILTIVLLIQKQY